MQLFSCTCVMEQINVIFNCSLDSSATGMSLYWSETRGPVMLNKWFCHLQEILSWKRWVWWGRHTFTCLSTPGEFLHCKALIIRPLLNFASWILSVRDGRCLEAVLWLVLLSTHLWTNEITFTQTTCPDSWCPPSPKLNQRCHLQPNLSLSLLERPGNHPLFCSWDRLFCFLFSHRPFFFVVSCYCFCWRPALSCVVASAKQVSGDGTPVVAVTKVQVPKLWR